MTSPLGFWFAAMATEATEQASAMIEELSIALVGVLWRHQVYAIETDRAE